MENPTSTSQLIGINTVHALNKNWVLFSSSQYNVAVVMHFRFTGKFQDSMCVAHGAGMPWVVFVVIAESETLLPTGSDSNKVCWAPRNLKWFEVSITYWFRKANKYLMTIRTDSGIFSSIWRIFTTLSSTLEISERKSKVKKSTPCYDRIPNKLQPLWTVKTGVSERSAQPVYEGRWHAQKRDWRESWSTPV